MLTANPALAATSCAKPAMLPRSPLPFSFTASSASSATAPAFSRLPLLGLLFLGLFLGDEEVAFLGLSLVGDFAFLGLSLLGDLAFLGLVVLEGLLALAGLWLLAGLLLALAGEDLVGDAFLGEAALAGDAVSLLAGLGVLAFFAGGPDSSASALRFLPATAAAAGFVASDFLTAAALFLVDRAPCSTLAATTWTAAAADFFAFVATVLVLAEASFRSLSAAADAFLDVVAEAALAFFWTFLVVADFFTLSAETLASFLTTFFASAAFGLISLAAFAAFALATFFAASACDLASAAAAAACFLTFSVSSEFMAVVLAPRGSLLRVAAMAARYRLGSHQFSSVSKHSARADANSNSQSSLRKSRGVRGRHTIMCMKENSSWGAKRVTRS